MTDKERERLIKGRNDLYSKPLVSKNKLWRACQGAIFGGLLIPVCLFGFKPIFGAKIKNKENLKRLKGKGFVVVCNHVHVFDVGAVFYACLMRHVMQTSQEETMYIGGLRTILRLYKSVPILKTREGLNRFMSEMSEEIKNGGCCSIFPEGELETMCDHLRPFKSGAFKLAHRADAPILPMVITPRRADGLRKLFKREYSLTIEIGEPIMPDSDQKEHTDAARLKSEAIEAMNKMLDNPDKIKPKNIKKDDDKFWQVKKGKEI